MLLIMVNQWVGPGIRMSPSEFKSKNELISFHTDMPLHQALARLRQHQDAYNAHYSLAVNFTLLSVSEIPRVPLQQLEDLRVTDIATLCIDSEKMGL